MRLGIVSAVDASKKAVRVTHPDQDNVVSAWMQVMGFAWPAAGLKVGQRVLVDYFDRKLGFCFGTIGDSYEWLRGSVVNVFDYGAKGDGVHDDWKAFNDAINDLNERGGGTLLVPPASYAISAPIGKTDDYLNHVTITGLAQRGVHWTFGDGALNPDTGKPWVAGAYIRCLNNTPVITGMWENCSIRHLALDADMRGSACVNAHFSKSQMYDCELVGWSGYGMLLNNGDFTDELGFLNRIENCNISDTGEEVGVALQLEYRFIDSWIVNNNIESHSGANIQINSGGPYRIIGNHLNGNRSPLHNILINGGLRECIIAHNILEGSREEAIKYTAPGWLSTPERAAITITSNIVRQAVQSGNKPIFSFNGVGGSGFVAHGLSIVGNDITTDYEPTYVVELNNFEDVSMVGNYWRAGHDPGLDPVKAINCTNVEVIGNHGDNGIEVV